MGFQAKPVFHHVGRWPDSMAQYNVGHKQRVDQIKSLMSQLPGIAIGGNGYNGIGVPDCIHSGKEAAKSMAEQLTSAAVTSAAAR
jgi:oxygen-dependent protoporphyrinogen oxidase